MNKIKEETIYETYSRAVCKICKNAKNCQEELRMKIDSSIRCDKFETTFIPNKVDSIQFGTEW